MNVVHGAVRDALRLQAISYDAVKHLALCRPGGVRRHFWICARPRAGISRPGSTSAPIRTGPRRAWRPRRPRATGSCWPNPGQEARRDRGDRGARNPAPPSSEKAETADGAEGVREDRASMRHGKRRPRPLSGPADRTGAARWRAPPFRELRAFARGREARMIDRRIKAAKFPSIKSEPPRVYRRVKLSNDEPYDPKKAHSDLHG